MSLSFQQMESHILGAKQALDAATDVDKARSLGSIAQGHALLVIAECMYRRELREGQ
jgi:hypothetical protein